MQIAAREDQPRFDVTVGTGGPNRSSGNPFDQIMRSMNARDSARNTGAPEPNREVRDDEPAHVEDHRSRHAARTDNAGNQSGEEAGDDRSSKSDDNLPTDCETCITEDAPIRDDPGAVHEGATSEETAAASPDEPTQEAQQPETTTRPTAEQTAEPDQGSGATSHEATQRAVQSKPQLGNQPISEEVLGQLDAFLQARLGDARLGLANAPFALSLANGALSNGALSNALGNGVMNHGLMTAVMAQSLAGQQSPAAPGAVAHQAGLRNAASAILPGNVAKRAPGVEAQSPNSNVTAAMDFKSIAAALAKQSGSQANTTATPSPGAGTAALDAAGNGTGSSNANAMAQGLTDRAAQTAKADAPAQPAGHQRLSGPQFAERIGLTIARAADSGVDQVSIRLNPRELGRIDVKMELGQDGRMNLTVTADRPDTLDQLQRNMRDLERSLNDAGFDTSAGDLNFSLRQDQSSNDQAGGTGGNGTLGDGEPGLDESGIQAEDGMIITHHSDGTMVVDLFV